MLLGRDVESPRPGDRQRSVAKSQGAHRVGVAKGDAKGDGCGSAVAAVAQDRLGLAKSGRRCARPVASAFEALAQRPPRRRTVATVESCSLRAAGTDDVPSGLIASSTAEVSSAPLSRA